MLALWQCGGRTQPAAVVVQDDCLSGSTRCRSGRRRLAAAHCRDAASLDCQPARLAGQPATLLGRADSHRSLSGMRNRAGPRGATAGAPAAAAHRCIRAAGRWPQSAGQHRGVRPHDLPAVRRTGAARDRHHGRLRLLIVVLPAFCQPARRRLCLRPRGGTALVAGRSVCWRCGTCHGTSAVRALLHPGAGRRRSD